MVTSDTRVVRDKNYDGNAENERCTVVLRLSPTFIRFGSFEIFKPEDPETGRAGPSVGNTELLHKLLNRVAKYYPEIEAKFTDEERPQRNLGE